MGRLIITDRLKPYRLKYEIFWVEEAWIGMLQIEGIDKSFVASGIAPQFVVEQLNAAVVNHLHPKRKKNVRKNSKTATPTA